MSVAEPARRWGLSDTGHNIPRNELNEEALHWPDRHRIRERDHRDGAR